MKLYSTSAATVLLSTTRDQVDAVADALELGRGGNRAESRRNWLFTDDELATMRRHLAA